MGVCQAAGTRANTGLRLATSSDEMVGTRMKRKTAKKECDSAEVEKSFMFGIRKLQLYSQALNCRTRVVKDEDEKYGDTYACLQ